MTAHDPLLLDRQLCFAVYAAGNAFNAAYKPMLDRLGLTYPQYLVLLVLWERDDVTVNEICTRLHLDSGTVSPMLKRLEAAGHLRRRRAPPDERVVRVELTDQGRSLREKAGVGREAVVCALGGSEEPIQALRQELHRIIPLLRNVPAAPRSVEESAPKRQSRGEDAA
jgi:DNA-binding MarR family transcriptional regulator